MDTDNVQWEKWLNEAEEQEPRSGRMTMRPYGNKKPIGLMGFFILILALGIYVL